ncbi:MAG: hypothetical protein EHM50_10320 [Lysobacterales bacterium]|nr:MAG: hypothetical protein EHM50_10320 [Xanthomonadales bacterium]
MPIEDELQDRRNDYDVTNTVQVSSSRQVRVAVAELFAALYPSSSFDSVWMAFHDFERVFRGLDPSYHAVDTTYHDMQHTLDMTLALARLIAGHEMSVEPHDRLGPDRAELAIVSALFHDVGYLRHKERDYAAANGAVFTRVHVTRSGHYLERYLPRIGLEQFVPVVARIVHFTGYEQNVDQIELDEPKDSVVGHLLGTADLVAQLADRCYLEKCRDRLYPEFVLGGVAVSRNDAGLKVVYGSGLDVLRQTPDFVAYTMRTRLDGEFGGAYRYVEALYGGRNPYIEAIERSLEHLKFVLRTQRWSMLRREPPCFTWEKNPLQTMRTLVIDHLKTTITAA